MASPRAARFWVIAAAIAIAIAAAYADAVTSPLVFDDAAVVGGIAMPGSTVSGRPLLQATFAVQGAAPALGALHAVNLTIHAASAVTLFALLIGLELPLETAALAAAIWALHPLQTESVTYVAQRAESLAGLFILATVAAGVWRRYPVSVACCVAGLATKETAIVAPVLAWVLLRWVVRREAPRWYFPTLFATWPVAAAYYLGSQGRATTAGLHTTVSIGSYLQTQAWAIPHYVRLALWPHPLVFDYGVWIESQWPWRSLAGLAVGLIVVLAPLRRSRWTWFGLLWFLACLAPSSSFVPVATQTVAEHRMYLALAPIAVLVAWSLGKLGRRVLLGGGFALGCGLAGLTAARNRDYRSPEVLWRRTTQDWPANARAWLNLGAAVLSRGDAAAARGIFLAAIERQPVDPEAYRNLGDAELKLDRPAEAVQALQTAVAERSDYGDAWFDLGMAQERVGEHGLAASAYLRAETLRPWDAAPHVNRASVLSHEGDATGAIAEYTAALRLEPRNADTLFNRGNAHARAAEWPEAARDYRAALAINPALPDASANLALAEQQAAAFQHRQ